MQVDQRVDQVGPRQLGIGDPLVQAGVVGLHAKGEETIALSGEVLLIGGASGVPDK